MTSLEKSKKGDQIELAAFSIPSFPGFPSIFYSLSPTFSSAPADHQSPIYQLPIYQIPITNLIHPLTNIQSSRREHLRHLIIFQAGSALVLDYVFQWNVIDAVALQPHHDAAGPGQQGLHGTDAHA